MNKIKQWCDAIRQEDGHKLSSGSLRTLKMIEDEFTRMQANKISSKPMLVDSFLCALATEKRCEKQCFTCSEDQKCDERHTKNLH